MLKAEAAGLVHKTEADAVKLGLHGEQEIRAAYGAESGAALSNHPSDVLSCHSEYGQLPFYVVGLLSH